MSRAADVISDAIGGKRYSAGTSGCATWQVNGVGSIPWLLHLHFVVGLLAVHLGIDAVARRVREHLEALTDALTLGGRPIGARGDATAFFDCRDEQIAFRGIDVDVTGEFRRLERRVPASAEVLTR